MIDAIDAEARPLPSLLYGTAWKKARTRALVASLHNPVPGAVNDRPASAVR